MKVLLFLLIPIFCFSQEDNYVKLKKLPKAAFEKAVNDSITKLTAGDLWNFLRALQVEYNTDLKPFNNSFIKKMEICDNELEMHFLLKFLLEQNTNKIILGNILNSRKEIWDHRLWAEAFWKVIRENNLNVKEGHNYAVDKKGQKTINIKAFWEEKIQSNELGANPLLFINGRITSYPENQLMETLIKLSIKDIEIVTKDKAPNIYGIRGKDGFMQILTNAKP
jgi:hypothetical protein